MIEEVKLDQDRETKSTSSLIIKYQNLYKKKNYAQTSTTYLFDINLAILHATMYISSITI